MLIGVCGSKGAQAQGLLQGVAARGVGGPAMVKKALVVGLNYPNQKHQLYGCGWVIHPLYQYMDSTSPPPVPPTNCKK